MVSAAALRRVQPWRGVLPLLCLGLVACSGDTQTGPAPVKWDRFPCERCRMVLSDRHHAAQVRTHLPDGRSPVFFFDDIGCAVVWLQDKPFQDDPGTEIWVNDWRTGAWIDARQAHYVRGGITPMEYGLGAQLEPTPDSLDWAAAKQRIFEVESKYNVHGRHLGTAPPER